MSELVHQPVLRTTWDRSRCTVGVVHVGYGAFHRAHQAWYFDRMMQAGAELRWGIAAVNLRAEESAQFAASSTGDGDYLLKTIASDGAAEYRVVRPHLDFVDWSRTPDRATDLVASPDVRLLTITVTESGYYLGEDGELDIASPLIAEELDGGSRRSVYAYLRDALDARRRAGTGPITVLCCDNLRHNGPLLRGAFHAYLQALGDDALPRWLVSNASFPASMVDRITPRAPHGLAEDSAHETGEPVRTTVLAEDFAQWVIEDDFRAARPPLELAGAQIVPSVEPHEEAKIRILNGGHTALAYLGALAGYATFDELMRDQQLLAHFRAFQVQEVLPALGDDFPLDLAAYAAAVEQRFGNPYIADTIGRICMDGVSKMRIFMLPTIEGCLRRGIRPTNAYRSIASWVHFVRAVIDGTNPVPYPDPELAPLASLFEPGLERELAGEPALWGELPAIYPHFASDLANSIGRFTLRGGA